MPDLCVAMGEGGCNIAYAAVDRHAEGPEAGRTALRFIADTPELTTHDISYAELGTARPDVSPTCCAAWESARAIASSS